jgi:hypothetical protein
VGSFLSPEILPGLGLERSFHSGGGPCPARWPLQEVVDAQRANGWPIERIYKHLHRIVEKPDLRPGVTLAALAAAIKCGVKSPAIRTQISVTKPTRHYDKLDIRNA